MQKLILITGDLAAGKSTFSEILSERYHIHVFNKDTIKEVLGDTIGFTNREENLKLSNAAIELMIFLTERFCKLRESLILEANFHKEELRRISDIAEEAGFDVLVLNLQADSKVLHKRFLARLEENRHPVHKSVLLNDFDAFNGYLEKARKEISEGNIIQINADDFTYQKDEKLLSKIDEFYKTVRTEPLPSVGKKPLRNGD